MVCKRLAVIPLLMAFFLAVPSPRGFAEEEVFTEAELDQMLAPVALYPDALLSQILMAATYPLEVVEASRWSDANPGLDGAEAVDAVEDMNWDPSVKALVAFPELLTRMDDNLQWTQRLGDAYLIQEPDVIDSIQRLREEAYAAGHLNNMQYARAYRDRGIIVIEPASPQIVYVPYYEPATIYHNWWRPVYPSFYWGPPPGYHSGLSFYWGHGIHIAPVFFYSTFHWHDRHIVIVDRHHYRPYYSGSGYRERFNNAQRWSHDPRHRRGVDYSHRGPREQYGHYNASREGFGHQRDSRDSRRDSYSREDGFRNDQRGDSVRREGSGREWNGRDANARDPNGRDAINRNSVGREPGNREPGNRESGSLESRNRDSREASNRDSISRDRSNRDLSRGEAGRDDSRRGDISRREQSAQGGIVPRDTARQDRFQQDRARQDRFSGDSFRESRTQENRAQENRVRENRVRENRAQESRAQQERAQRDIGRSESLQRGPSVRESGRSGIDGQRRADQPEYQRPQSAQRPAFTPASSTDTRQRSMDPRASSPRESGRQDFGSRSSSGFGSERVRPESSSQGERNYRATAPRPERAAEFQRPSSELQPQSRQPMNDRQEIVRASDRAERSAGWAGSSDSGRGSVASGWSGGNSGRDARQESRSMERDMQRGGGDERSRDEGRGRQHERQ